MSFQNKLGQVFQIGDYIARPTKSGGARYNAIMLVVKFNAKTIGCVNTSVSQPEGSPHSRPTNIVNYEECMIVTDAVKKHYGINNK